MLVQKALKIGIVLMRDIGVEEGGTITLIILVVTLRNICFELLHNWNSFIFCRLISSVAALYSSPSWVLKRMRKESEGFGNIILRSIAVPADNLIYLFW